MGFTERLHCNEISSQRVIEKYQNNSPKLIEVKNNSSDLIKYIGLYENGKKEFEVNGQNQIAVGEKIIFNEAGNVIQIDSIKSNNCLISDCCCKEMSITRFDNKGKKIEYLQKSNGQFNGFTFKFDKKGQKNEGIFKNGKKEGIWKIYLPNNKLKMIRTYKAVSYTHLTLPTIYSV